MARFLESLLWDFFAVYNTLGSFFQVTVVRWPLCLIINNSCLVEICLGEYYDELYSKVDKFSDLKEKFKKRKLVVLIIIYLGLRRVKSCIG